MSLSSAGGIELETYYFTVDFVLVKLAVAVHIFKTQTVLLVNHPTASEHHILYSRPDGIMRGCYNNNSKSLLVWRYSVTDLCSVFGTLACVDHSKGPQAKKGWGDGR